MSLSELHLTSISELPNNFTGIVLFPNSKEHYEGGVLHREDGPAVEILDEFGNGAKFWYYQGHYHRENGPAIEWMNGREEYFNHGQLTQTKLVAKPSLTEIEVVMMADIPCNFTGIVNLKNITGSSKYWYKNGKKHRLNGPAVISEDGYQAWYQEDRLHRIGGPAEERTTGEQQWLVNGAFHREDGPAIINKAGTKYWYLHGILHREDGPAIECLNGFNEWFLNGKRHRLDGPAYTDYWGHSYWYKENRLHREDGPAIIYKDGRTEYWIEGTRLTQSIIDNNQKQELEFNFSTLKDIPKTFTGIALAEGHKQRLVLGKLHSLTEPAWTTPAGDTVWYRNGYKHRDGAPASVIYKGTNKELREWFKDGVLHRFDGPAVECLLGYEVWYQEGKKHRTDGPAVSNFNQSTEYWIEGKYLTPEEFFSFASNIDNVASYVPVEPKQKLEHIPPQ